MDRSKGGMPDRDCLEQRERFAAPDFTNDDELRTLTQSGDEQVIQQMSPGLFEDTPLTPDTDSPPLEPPNPARVMDWIQLGCIRLSSAVSSIETILYSGGMKLHRTFKNVVLPVAVPPETRIDRLYSIRIHKYASSIASTEW